MILIQFYLKIVPYLIEISSVVKTVEPFNSYQNTKIISTEISQLSGVLSVKKSLSKSYIKSKVSVLSTSIYLHQQTGLNINNISLETIELLTRFKIFQESIKTVLHSNARYFKKFSLTNLFLKT